MSEPSVPKSQATDREDIAWDFEGARCHHLRLGLQMTPAERRAASSPQQAGVT